MDDLISRTLRQIIERDKQDLRALRRRVATISRVVGGLDLRNKATFPAFFGRVLDAALDGSGLYDDVTSYMSANGFEMIAEDLPLGMHHFGLEHESRLVFETSSTRAFAGETPRGVEYFAVNYNRSEEWDLYAMSDAHEAEIFEDLSRALWGDRRALRLDIRQTNTYGGMKAVLTPLDLSEFEYVGGLVGQIEEWARFREVGLRRSVLLQGKPGSGKSTLCLHAARTLSQRTVLISSKLFEELGTGQWRALIQVLSPHLLILDDIDRVSAHILGSKLDVFEERNCDIPYLFFTSNNIEEIPPAFRRPGRIDQVLVVREPDEGLRRRMIDRFALTIGATIPEAHIERLQQLVADRSGAHALEAIKRGHVLGWDHALAPEDITFRDAPVDGDDD